MLGNTGAPKRIRTSGLCLRRAMFPHENGIKAEFLPISAVKQAKNKVRFLPAFTAPAPQADDRPKHLRTILAVMGVKHDR